MSDRKVLLAVGRPFDFSDEPYDGFVSRRLRTLELFRKHFHVCIMLLRPSHDGADVHPDLADLVVADIPVLSYDRSRAARLRDMGRSALRRNEPDAHATQVQRVMAQIMPTVAVTFGPWLEREFTPVFAMVPTVHFYEEELARMPEIAPQSTQARLLRRAEAFTDARAQPAPTSVVVIGPAEVTPARRRFPSSNIHWYPVLLDPAKFPIADDASDGDEVIVVGQFAQPRNADGLRDILMLLNEVPDAPTVTVISQSGLNRSLWGFVEAGMLNDAAFVDDLYGRYRQGRLALVPSRRATGIKSTILQAWAAGAPVVCFSAISSAFCGTADGALAAGASPEAVVQQIILVHASPALRATLASAGFNVLRKHFDPTVEDARLIELVTQTSLHPEWLAT